MDRNQEPGVEVGIRSQEEDPGQSEKLPELLGKNEGLCSLFRGETKGVAGPCV